MSPIQRELLLDLVAIVETVEMMVEAGIETQAVEIESWVAGIEGEVVVAVDCYAAAESAEHSCFFQHVDQIQVHVLVAGDLEVESGTYLQAGHDCTCTDLL